MQRHRLALTVLTFCVPLACDAPGDPEPMPGDGGAAETDGGAQDDGADTGAAEEDSGGEDDPGDETGDETGGSTDGGESEYPDSQEPVLAESTAELNEACGVELIATIDWPSFEANYGKGSLEGWDYGAGEARNYCLGITDTIGFYCRETEGVAEAFAALGLTQIHCYWSDELPYDPPPEIDTRENMIMEIDENGVQTWGMNWWSANIEDQVWGWVTKL